MPRPHEIYMRHNDPCLRGHAAWTTKELGRQWELGSTAEACLLMHARLPHHLSITKEHFKSLEILRMTGSRDVDENR